MAMSDIYSGSTPKFLMRLKDDGGVRIDPSDPQTIVDVLVYIYNAITGVIIGKFYLNTEPEANQGWIQMTIAEIDPGDKRIKLVLTSAITEAAAGNSNMIQVDLHIADADCENSTRIDIKKGQFPEIKPAAG